MSDVHHLGIVGSGPSCTYLVERIAAELAAYDSFHLHLHVFDPSGEFGAGAVHSPRQPVSSPLNRIAGQLAFGADDTNEAAAALLPEEERIDFLAWCTQQYRRTADPRFDLTAESWPPRYLHGMALRARFERFTDIIRACPGSTVTLHTARVDDLEPSGALIRAHLHDPIGGARSVLLDHVVLATGHTATVPEPGSEQELLSRAAGRGFQYVHSAYPLRDALAGVPEDAAHVTLGCRGMGLTAFDVLLCLVEERGGRFERQPDGDVKYVRSGREPTVVVFSRSGVFTSARPFNAKEADPAQREHRGVFFTIDAIDRLRRSRGRRQLAFERHVLPLMLLEMRLVYYRTLLGAAFGRAIEHAAGDNWRRFVDECPDCHHDPDAAVAYLCGAVDALADDAMDLVATALAGLDDGVLPPASSIVGQMLAHYVGTVFGDDARARLEAGEHTGEGLAAWWRTVSPRWDHDRAPRAHRFDFDRLIHPIEAGDHASPEAYVSAVLACMRRDLQQARQDNMRNPIKAACDSIWRDLRPVLGHVIDEGGLTAASHAAFMRCYLPIHNRLCNGAPLEVMEKIVALIEAGVVDVGTGPDPELRIQDSALWIKGRTGMTRRLDILIEAWVHPFDVRRQGTPLYGNLLKRGLVRPWANPDTASGRYESGGLDIDGRQHVIGRDGRACENITVVGAPTEGRVFYPIGAARPRQNHHVLNDVIRCHASWMARVPSRCYERRPPCLAAREAV